MLLPRDHLSSTVCSWRRGAHISTLRGVLVFGLAALVAAVAFGRVYLGYHTPHQVQQSHVLCPTCHQHTARCCGEWPLGEPWRPCGMAYTDWWRLWFFLLSSATPWLARC